LAGRGTDFSHLNFDHVYKYEDPDQQRIAYTIAPYSSLNTSFSNLILEIVEGKPQPPYWTTFTPNVAFDAEHPFELATFSGKITWTSLQGDMLAQTQYTKGNPVLPKEGTQGRAAGCEYLVVYDVTEVCINGDCSVTDMSVANIIEVCDISDGSGVDGPGSGGSTGGSGSVGVFEPEFFYQQFNLCANTLNFKLTHAGFYAEIDGLGILVIDPTENRTIDGAFGTTCVGLNPRYFGTKYDAAEAFAEIYNQAHRNVRPTIQSQTNLTGAFVREELKREIKRLLQEFYPGSTLSTHTCGGGIPISTAGYGCN